MNELTTRERDLDRILCIFMKDMSRRERRDALMILVNDENTDPDIRIKAHEYASRLQCFEVAGKAELTTILSALNGQPITPTDEQLRPVLLDRLWQVLECYD